MSEQGWQGFLAAEGVDDWVVLARRSDGGVPRRDRSGRRRGWPRRSRDVPGLEGSGALLTIADDRLTVRLSRDLWQLESRHVDLARAVSAVAQAHGAVADRAAVQEVQLAIAAKPDAIDVELLARRARLRRHGRRQRRRSARTRIDGLDAGARRGQAVAARDAHRRVGRTRAGRGAARGSAGSRRPRRGRLGAPATGRSPTVPATASASARGQTGPATPSPDAPAQPARDQ